MVGNFPSVGQNPAGNRLPRVNGFLQGPALFRRRQILAPQQPNYRDSFGDLRAPDARQFRRILLRQTEQFATRGIDERKAAL
ncbi:MAG: hypothetical protein OEY16_06395, partial [Alphaproteobacteria bacterium]|nr:hypothetical protein [Alphaproteobacteria bacterium]